MSSAPSRPPPESFAAGMQYIASLLLWFLIGLVLGLLMAGWKAPGSETAMIASALLFPATIVLGWMLMFPLALLALPFAIPRFLRWLREPRPPQRLSEEVPQAPRATAVGWVFVAAAVPTSLAAGLIAGAPLSYLLAGLAYGYLLRRSAVLQDVSL